MVDSILSSTKNALGLPIDETAFDDVIVMHINSTFADLNQMGVGPEESFLIEDDLATWQDFFAGERNTASVKTYVYLAVRLLFDPPTTSYALSAMQAQIDKLGWRLNVQGEAVRHPWIAETATES